MTLQNIKKSAENFIKIANKYKDKHHKRALVLKIFYYVLGGSATIITAVTGITVLPDIIATGSYVGTILAMIAAICTVILTFYQLGSKTECHSKVEVLCEKLAERIELFKDNECYPESDLGELTKAIKKFQLEITQMIDMSGKCRTFSS